MKVNATSIFERILRDEKIPHRNLIVGVIGAPLVARSTARWVDVAALAIQCATTPKRRFLRAARFVTAAAVLGFFESVDWRRATHMRQRHNSAESDDTEDEPMVDLDFQTYPVYTLGDRLTIKVRAVQRRINAIPDYSLRILARIWLPFGRAAVAGNSSAYTELRWSMAWFVCSKWQTSLSVMSWFDVSWRRQWRTSLSYMSR